jgi:hypothetical protein
VLFASLRAGEDRNHLFQRYAKTRDAIFGEPPLCGLYAGQRSVFLWDQRWIASEMVDRQASRLVSERRGTAFLKTTDVLTATLCHEAN